MITPQIINRGRGRELAATRFTVFDVIPYLQKRRVISAMGLEAAPPMLTIALKGIFDDWQRRLR